jgi:hypothetical protein
MTDQPFAINVAVAAGMRQLRTGDRLRCLPTQLAVKLLRKLSNDLAYL